MTLPFPIPWWIYVVAGLTVLAGLAWVLLCIIRAAYCVGRLRAHTELKRRYNTKWILFPEGKGPAGVGNIVVHGDLRALPLPGGQKYLWN